MPDAPQPAIRTRCIEFAAAKTEALIINMIITAWRGNCRDRQGGCLTRALGASLLRRPPSRRPVTLAGVVTRVEMG